MVLVLKNSTALILTFKVSNSSTHLTRVFPNLGDTLVYRAGILIYHITVKYLKMLSFNVNVFRNVFDVYASIIDKLLFFRYRS